MTLGIRIAERRKKLGMSQEALGERMGVSRQAISKWEADAAVPEIDKLIVLSRLFEVSVGWLLGIDEEPVEKSSGFTDEQLYMVEEIVKRYQQPRQGAGRLRKILVQYGTALTLCASTLALCLSGVALWKFNSPEIREAQYQLSSLSIGYDQLQKQMENISWQLEKQEAGEGLLEDFAITAEALDDLSGARVRFAGTPESWNPQDTGILSVRREGQEVARGQCTWNGTVLEAELQLPSADGYEYYFLLCRQDGTQEQKNITGGIQNQDIIDIAKGLSFRYNFDFEGGWGRTVEGEPWRLYINGYHAYIKTPALLGEDPGLETVEVVLYQNGQEVARTPLEVTYNPGIYTTMEVSTQITTSEEVDYFAEISLDPELLLENLTAQDQVEAVLEIRIKDGVTWRETVETWDSEELW